MKIEIMAFNENEDGSADCSFETDKEGKEALFRYGLLALLKEALAQGHGLLPTEIKNDGQ
jgi:hypothetical protein